MRSELFVSEVFSRRGGKACAAAGDDVGEGFVRGGADVGRFDGLDSEGPSCLGIVSSAGA